MRNSLFQSDEVAYDESAKRFRLNSRGVALVLVLWILAFLSVLVGEFCFATRTEINITTNFKEETLSYYYAKAGVNLATYRILNNGPFPRDIEGDETPPNEEANEWCLGEKIPPVAFREGRIEIEIGNESGKININQADAGLLMMMLSPFDLDDQDKNIIVDSILDWRDRDDLYRINGAEDDYYQSLDAPYGAKNGDFDSIDELLLVRGVTPAIFFGGLREMLTIYPRGNADDLKVKTSGDRGRINVNAAPPQVLRALPMMDDDLVLSIVEHRAEEPFRSVNEMSPIVGGEVYGAISRYLSIDSGPYYIIRATGMVSGSPARRGIEVILEIDKTRNPPYRRVEWLDNLEFWLESQEESVDFSG
ncbi:MAG: general secretion pathway protein GspK [Deltaproteobacteria bacterium]|nr:general secretion pathway protein GspK [Deltaproteobacteria bacterium]